MIENNRDIQKFYTTQIQDKVGCGIRKKEKALRFENIISITLSRFLSVASN